MSYLVTDILVAMKEFLNVPSQRLTAVNSIMAVLESEDRVSFYDAECENGHKLIKVTKIACMDLRKHFPKKTSVLKQTIKKQLKIEVSEESL